MLLQHRRSFHTLIRAFDLVALCGSASVAHFEAWGKIPEVTWHLVIEFATIAVVWIYLAKRFDVYQSRRSTSFWNDLSAVLQTLILTSGVVWLARGLFAFGVPQHAWTSLILSFALTGGARAVLRGCLAWLRSHGRNTRNYLFLGRGRTLHKIAADIVTHPSYGIRILGGLSFTGEELQPVIPGVKTLGTTEHLQDLVRQESIDEIVVCPADGVWTTEVKSVLRFCQAAGIDCRLAPDFLGIPMARTSIAPIGQVPAYLVHAGFNDDGGMVWKRIFDIIGSLSGILLLAPLMTAAAIAIKLTSPGPILFRQKRVGMNGRDFTMLKFRSMYRDAEKRRAELMAKNEQSGPVFKIKDDPRITRVGRLLRKYSLDELPQLFNVLHGDMSIVGPRPPLPLEVQQYDWWQRRRLAVRPGLTCLWQVSGRNTIGFERWMEMDLQYIDGWSLGLDLKIMAKTVGEVFRGGGA